MSGCEAKQGVTGMYCVRCGTCWDVDDPNPPECKTDPTKEMLEKFVEVSVSPTIVDAIVESGFEPDPHYKEYPPIIDDCDYTEQQLRTVALDDMLVESMKMLTSASTQAKLLHPGDIQGLIEVAEMACDFHEHTQSLPQRANFELAKIREKLK